MELHALHGEAPVAQPMISPSSAFAEISSSGGKLSSSTTSE